MNNIGVYKIVNKVNNKWYVGSSFDVGKRWKRHRKLLQSNTHNNDKLQSSWNKHGADQFIFELIQSCDSIELALQLEQSIIDEHFGQEYFYNLSAYATLPSEEIKNKLRQIAKSRPKFSKETLDKCKQSGAIGARKRWDNMTDEQRNDFRERMREFGRKGGKKVIESTKNNPEKMERFLEQCRKGAVTTNKIRWSFDSL